MIGPLRLNFNFLALQNISPYKILILLQVGNG